MNFVVIPNFSEAHPNVDPKSRARRLKGVIRATNRAVHRSYDQMSLYHATKYPGFKKSVVAARNRAMKGGRILWKHAPEGSYDKIHVPAPNWHPTTKSDAQKSSSRVKFRSAFSARGMSSGWLGDAASLRKQMTVRDRKTKKLKLKSMYKGDSTGKSKPNLKDRYRSSIKSARRRMQLGLRELP